MRKILFYCCFLLAVKLGAAGLTGELSIADTLPVNDQAIKNMVLQFSGENPQLKITLDKMPLAEAIQKLRDGKLDLALAEEYMVPSDYRLRRRYCAEVAFIFINAANSKRDYTCKELYTIFSGDISNWESLNGATYALHRLGVPNGAPGANVFERLAMQNKPISQAVYRKLFTVEIILLTGTNANTIAFTGYPNTELGTDIREAAVDGVAPTIGNIQSGKYPLMSYRVVLLGNRIKVPARIFLQKLSGKPFSDLLYENNMMPLR